MTVHDVHTWRIACDHLQASAQGLMDCEAVLIVAADTKHEARNQVRNNHGWQHLPPDTDLCSTHARKD